MNRKAYFSLIVITCVILTIFALYYGGLSHYFTLATIQSQASYLQQLTHQYRGMATLIFIAISTFLIICTLPVTGPMSVVGGFLFGFIPGVLYSMVAIAIGTTISFLGIRYFLMQAMQQKYGQRLIQFKKTLALQGNSYLISLQLLAIIPFFIINTLAALAGVSFFTFFYTTMIGSFPVVAIYTFAGKQLYTLRSWQDILNKDMMFLLLLLAVLALLPMFIKRRRVSDKDGDV